MPEKKVLTSFQLLRRFHRELSPQDAVIVWRYSDLLLQAKPVLRQQIISLLEIYESSGEVLDNEVEG